MNSDLTLLLAIVGAALIAGVILGILVMSIFRRSPVRAAPTAKAAGDEILRIEGDPVARQLKLRVSGLPVAGVDSIADEKIREHVRALMQLLAQEPDEPAKAAEVPSVARATTPAPPEPPGSVPAPPPVAPDDFSAPFITRLTTSLRPQPAPEPAPVKMTPAPKPQPAKGQPATKSTTVMFEQINAILQRKLAAQPGAPEMEIYEDDGELRILVSGEVFHQVDAVTDERARTRIREAVAEWEASQI